MELKEEVTKKRMSKPLRIILKSLAAIAGAILLFIAIVFIVDKISSKIEQGKIQAYGQLVPVDGKKMNVLIQGNGEETVVLLPGYGTAAPVLDFKQLIDKLSLDFKVVAIEPFGYGLSDRTNKERNTDNIVSEIHEALQQLNIDRYTLMGHSIAGIYGMAYANKYPDEVRAFAGIDSSVPTQGGMDVTFPITTFKLLKQSGFGRLLLKLGSDPYAELPFDEEAKEQMRMITLKNMYNKSVLNEMENISSNFNGAQHSEFPKELPLILFVDAGNTSNEGWIPLHEEQANHSVQGKMMTFEGGHYLHHLRSKEIAENFKQFMQELK
ncbi:alpha/beta hydrolase [Cohnella sp. LGH]|uniref:alpha/beta hydrolase n=1 Tax=unclassified Cohnella TaxID=2636738 RepID=UPI001ADC7974|nr:alpha/beta hydrolase [Cohnella sp. LGH]QTH45231.1 alpha/beta hydrolase [Cohnella sp. LGH]